MAENETAHDQKSLARHNHQRDHHEEQAAIAEGQHADYAGALPVSISLLSNSSATGRGNGSVRAAAIQRMQQSYGNRATRSFIQRSVAVQRHPIAQQKEEEMLEKPSAVQRMAEVGAEAQVQRHVEVQRRGGLLSKKKTPKLSATDPKRIENAKLLAKKTTPGAHAVSTIDKYKTAMVFGTSGGGAFYAHGDNKITLDPGASDPDQAFTIVHEAGHVEYAHKNKSVGSQAQTLAKDVYVGGMLDEETEATVRQIETKVQLSADGVSIKGATEQAGEKSYKKGYKEGCKKALKDKKSKAEAKEAGRKAGATLVRKDFQEGLTIVTSTTGEPYSKYYGDFWDKVNTTKKGGAGTGI